MPAGLKWEESEKKPMAERERRRTTRRDATT